MKVTFIGADPREKARPLLDAILERGVDQIAIACAFLTEGGVELLRRHVAHLTLQKSFVVVAWEPVTDSESVEKLHALCPGNLYIHLGAKNPIEKKVGPGLMHSKVFLARAGDDCWLWTGSHNLTASAAQGANCEAAVLLEGKIAERPFKDALAHLNQCKDEAVLFDPYNPPPTQHPEYTLIVHAERHAQLKAPPWFVHLRPPTTTYDRAMRPPSSIWLYLYQPGSLKPGHRRPPAESAYSGNITALNFTEYHADRGIPADWRNADFVIEQQAGVFGLAKPTAHSGRTPTQGVFRIDKQERPSTIWLTASPSPKRERVVGAQWTTDLDPDLRQFFTPSSVQAGRLVHREYRDIRLTYRVPRKEIGDLEATDLLPRLSVAKNATIEVNEKARADDHFAFIYKARYRL